jgi:multidrug resistance efflux pump
MAKTTAWAKRRRFKLLALLAALLLAVAVTLVVAIFAQAAPHTVDSTADRVDSNIAGGGGLYTETGPVDISKSTFT